ncbi:membrane hypothetical protein [Candidatus Accumulibacter aalborgensis]|uniref:Uncharacterized protein n=2 Tax=Candidatus Accumulibacter aalborgensis TaxID=1860102 RepID=A0A1A8XFM2_9PROT|nr:membrane hypothetical protein [Candidatus Accumulibacter aalborgensis]
MTSRMPVLTRWQSSFLGAGILMLFGSAACAALLGAFLTLLLALPARASADPPGDVVSRIAAENAALAAQLATGEQVLATARSDLVGLGKSQSDLERSMQRIEGHAQVHALARAFAQTVIEQLSVLPQTERFDAQRRQRDGLLEATNEANLGTERALDQLGDIETAVTARLAGAQPPVPEAQRSAIEAVARERLGEQRALLQRLDEQQRALLQALQQSDAADVDLARRTDEARAELTRLLFWVPSPPGSRTISDLPQSLAWMVSAANWRTAAIFLGDEVMRRPFWPASALLLAGGLYLARRRLQARLVALAPTAASYEHYWIGHTIGALAITVALALPGPLVMWTAGKLLAAAPQAQSFTLALSASLLAIAQLLLALSAFSGLLDRGGIGRGHFGWDESLLTYSRRALHRLAMLFVPLLFVATLNGLDNAPYANRQSIGRTAFSVALIVVAVWLARLLRRKSPLMQRLYARAPRSGAVRLHGLWLAALLAVPLLIAALSASGYSVAAGYFFGRMLISLFLLLCALVLYGLIALWVQVERWRLGRRQAAEAARLAQAETIGETGSEVAEPRPPQLDIAAIGEQTRSLLDLFITLLLLGGIWWVWRGGVPALSVISDHVLWTYHASVDGQATTLPLTAGELFLALLVGGVTAVAVRNIGALLDIVLLQRFEVQADATYAIKVITRYALAAVGIVSAARILGVGWSDVHWLFAALGVGLGFGLQEIVANFVSGLIVLAERPIRIGDVVTVGEVSGTVSRIRARATAVVDFENKEVIIPNKAFITGSVVNWTLSNQTTRLLLKVGVAYGSDIACVQRLLTEAIRTHGDVLHEPAPTVFFVDFGDSSLDFEIRAFVGSFAQRLRVQHELNVAIEATLRTNGIEIPFPQRDLHLRTLPA